MGERPGSRPRGAGPARAPRSETRRRVLDAAYAVFGERGIAASTLTDVAEHAGLTKGAIYSSFAGKDELVLTLMEERVMERLTGALAGFSHTTDRDVALAEAGRVIVDAMRSDPAAHRLLAEYYATSHRHPRQREGLLARRRADRASIARAVTAVAASTGLTLPMPADEFALVLLALSNGLGMEAGIDPDAVPDDLYARLLGLLVRSG